jgi:hypothetical protein
VTPHSLRHSIHPSIDSPDRSTPLVQYLMGGALQEFLGHTSLAATGVYTQLTDPMLKEVVLRIPTALDLVAARQQGQEVRERWPAYQADVVGRIDPVDRWSGVLGGMDTQRPRVAEVLVPMERTMK